MKKTQLSVGIPAYNEAANVKILLKNLLSQKPTNFTLKEIIVVSDASNDGTDQAVASLKNSKIKLIRHKKRSGQAASQNEILKIFTGDLLVLLNADVLPSNNLFLSKIIQPFFKRENVGIVSGKVTPLPANNFFEKIINYSVSLKQDLYEKHNKKSNIYLCHGRARAFSKEFAKNFRWKQVVSEDSFSYLSCIIDGAKFVYTSQAEVLYRSPNNLQDHISQSARFLKSREDLKKHFPDEIVDKSFFIPRDLQLKAAAKGFVNNPMLFVSYVYILFLCKFISWKFFSNDILWNASKTSKSLSS